METCQTSGGKSLAIDIIGFLYVSAGFARKMRLEMMSSLSVSILPGLFGHSSCSDVQGLLQLLDDWLQNGREDLCQEFEQHLRESYTWPASERRLGSMATSAICSPFVTKFGVNATLGFNQ